MENLVPKIPNLEIGKLWFQVSNNLLKDKTALTNRLLEGIKKDEMAPFYQLLINSKILPFDKNLLTQLETKNKETLKKLQDKLLDAETNLGETDISDALLAIADHYCRIGDKESAETAYRVAYEKTGPLGLRIDIVFAMIRIGLFFNDQDLINRNIDKAKTLIEEGGDWDRRNRLKVYEGIHLISHRDFRGAADRLLDTLSTFTSTEIMEYKEFVKYAVLSASITLSRPDYKKKVVHSPEILEVVHEVPHLKEFAESLYACDYKQFFKSLAAVEQNMKSDRYLSSHYQYYVREMKILAYAQLLESYRSLTIESMANSFGVSEEFIDSDLAKYIAAGRLNAVIDKVGGIVETNRPDSKNAQYQGTIKQGDLLLNRIQKLSRVINV